MPGKFRSGLPSSGRGLDSGVQPYLPRSRGPKAPDDGIEWSEVIDECAERL